MWILIKPARMVNTDAIKEIHVSGCGVYYSTFDSENVYNLIGKYETEQQAKKAIEGIAYAIQQEQKVFLVPGDEEQT